MFPDTSPEYDNFLTFYAGAMSEAREIELGPIARRVDGLDLVLVGANDPEAMRRHTEECRSRGIPFVADPSQQLAFAGGADIRDLVEGATYLFTNEYEAHLTEQKTGWSAEQILERVGTRVITKGGDGAVILRRGEDPVEVPVVPGVSRVDPTGVGDAFRAGFLCGLSWGLPARRCAELGSVLATHVLETVGTQEYVLTHDGVLARLDRAYGADSAADVQPHLRARQA